MKKIFFLVLIFSFGFLVGSIADEKEKGAKIIDTEFKECRIVNEEGRDIKVDIKICKELGLI